MSTDQPTPRLNPRGGDRRGQRQLGRRSPVSMWYALALVLVLGLAQTYWLLPRGKPLLYSEFKTLVKSGSVS